MVRFSFNVLKKIFFYKKNNPYRANFAGIIIFTFIVFSSVFSLYFVKTDEEKEEYIEWSEKRKLRWSDYKGKPQRRNAVASTCYELRYIFPITLEGVVQPTVSVRALFFPKDSWKLDAFANDYILSHEQGHFDLVEIFARRLRRAIQSREYNSLRDLHAHIHSMYDSVNTSMEKIQELYDEDTENSMNTVRQEKWNQIIQKELYELKNYHNPVIHLRGKIRGKK